jgi:hypothetical protein
MGRLERRDDLLTRDGGKCIQELFDAITTFEVVDEISERDTSALEHRCATEDVRITVDNGPGARHGPPPPLDFTLILITE